MTDPAPAADGFHHPAGEAELAALVKAAYRQGRQLRVRGAGHSVSHAIYTDPGGLRRGAGIPFRLHWGKFQPNIAEGDREWVEFFRSQYPRWDDFLALRAERDPNNIFLTEYWRSRFGLWDEPQPAPRDS